MSNRTQKLMENTPIKSTQVSQEALAKDARSYRPGMKWELELNRARLLTEAYKQNESDPIVIKRAKGLSNILENMELYIRPGELIIGNFASTSDAVCHYPELQYKWVERETSKGRIFEDLLNDDEREELKELHAYWKNLSIHNIYKAYLPEELEDYTYTFNFECATPNYEKILSIGLNGIISEVQEKKKRLKDNLLNSTINALDYVQRNEFLDAVIISLDSAIKWGKRYAELARKTADSEQDPKRRAELEAIAQTCEQVPGNPARTLHEAIQSFWFIHLIVNFIEMPMVGDGIRFDVCMGPFYEKDFKEGRIDKDQALEMVECLFVKSQETGFLHPPIWSGQGGGAIGYQTLNIGGVDSDGKDVTNEISFLVLEAMKNIKTVTPPLAFRWHDNTPKKLVDKAIECMASGIPQPAFFNDKMNITRLTSFGISIEDARNYSINNCMVPTIPGKNLNHRSAWANGLPIPLCLTAALGLDVIPGYWKKPLGTALDEPENVSSIEELIDAVIENCAWAMRTAVGISNIGDALYQKYTPRPFLSGVLDDCIEKAQDVRDWEWGPGYREVMILGLNNCADSLAAIKKIVFDEKKATMAELINALKNNWEGYEDLHRMCLDAPKFGNDDDYVDLISLELGKGLRKEAAKIKTYLGQPLYVDGTAASAFWLHGATCPATPDGRSAGETFHDGSISPAGGRDSNGPTAVLKSVSKVDPQLTYNHLFNQSFMPQYLKGHNAETFYQYLKTFADLGIHHVQFSVVDRETLLDAQKHPENHTNLMVRVCGYSAYFIDLNKSMQDGIIARNSQCFAS